MLQIPCIFVLITSLRSLVMSTVSLESIFKWWYCIVHITVLLLLKMDGLVELQRRVVRKVYLITYARARENLCASREAFAQMVIEAFDFPNGIVNLLHWVVCREPHEGGGHHYHMAVCLSDNKRWGPAKRALERRGVIVHFQDRDSICNYVGAYIYVCKSDRDVLHSDPHPDLSNVVQYRTANASAANRRNAKKEASKKLTNLNVLLIIRSKGIKDETALHALAEENFDQGHTGLMEYLANTPERKYKELISKAWKIAESRATLQRQQTDRMGKIWNAVNQQCIDECGTNTVWLEMARTVLTNNQINAYVFAAALRQLLKNGREKGSNILITGPCDCAKTFVLRPLTKIFKCFTNPSSGTYAFVGIQNKEVAFLNDLRYNTLMLPWQDFLNLLEGMEVHIPTPKTHYAEDIELESDIPFFATSIGPIQFSGQSSDPVGEDAMMATRWHEFKFTHSIPKSEQVKFPPCPRCFAELVLMGSDLD